MHHQRLQWYQHELGSFSHPHPHPHPRLYLHPYLPQFQPHPHFLSPTQFHNLREAMLRQVEKENIRQEIIMSETIRRHALEAEVRYEMMMERAMAIQRGRNGFPSESPPLIWLDVPIWFPLAETGSEGMFLEERIIFLPPPSSPRSTLNNWREGEESKAMPFQRAPIDERMARLSEGEPVLEASSEKKKMNLQAKPIINITGAKRPRSGSGSSGSESDGNVKKKVKEEWSCALCHVSVDNECTLNIHLAGKKHKKKEAALSAQIATKKNSIKAALNALKAGKKNSRIPLSTNKVADSMKGSETANPAINIEVKLTSESLPHGNNGDASSATDGPSPLDGKLNSDNFKKKRKRNNKPKKTLDIFWCEICQISMPHTQKTIDTHQQGKKHKCRVKLGDSTSAVALPMRRRKLKNKMERM